MKDNQPKVDRICHIFSLCIYVVQNQIQIEFQKYCLNPPEILSETVVHAWSFSSIVASLIFQILIPHGMTGMVEYVFCRLGILVYSGAMLGGHCFSSFHCLQYEVSWNLSSSEEISVHD